MVSKKMKVVSKKKKVVSKKKKVKQYKYVVVCSICKKVKRTNYGEYKRKKDANMLDKHICRECKSKSKLSKNIRKKKK